jgi:hypothetical protein
MRLLSATLPREPVRNRTGRNIEGIILGARKTNRRSESCLEGETSPNTELREL